MLTFDSSADVSFLYIYTVILYNNPAAAEEKCSPVSMSDAEDFLNIYII